MKVASFTISSRTASYVLVPDKGVIDAGRRAEGLSDAEGAACRGLTRRVEGNSPARSLVYELQDVALLPTVPDPDKIFCIGVNCAHI